MTCTKHNLQMIRLVVRGRVRTAEHAALLAAVRRCRRCSPDRPPHPPRASPRGGAGPALRIDASVRELEHVLR